MSKNLDIGSPSEMWEAKSKQKTKQENREQVVEADIEEDLQRINAARDLEHLEEKECIHIDEKKDHAEERFIDDFKDGTDALEDADQWLEIGSMLAGGGIPLDGTQLIDDVVNQEFAIGEASEGVSDFSRDQQRNNEKSEAKKESYGPAPTGPTMQPGGRKKK